MIHEKKNSRDNKGIIMATLSFFLENPKQVWLFARFFVTLTLSKLRHLGKAKERLAFLLLFARFFVTLAFENINDSS